MLFCTKDGVQLVCMRNGALLFNDKLTKERRGDAYQCSQCGESVIEGWGDNYCESGRVIKELMSEWDGFLPHSEILHNQEPFCLKCQRLMVDQGEGVLFLPQGHAYKKGQVWQCVECGNKIIKISGYGGWPPPISEEERIAVIMQYPDKIFYLTR